MLKKILNKFESPEHPLLGPNIKILKFWGLLLPDSAKKYLYLFLHLSVILFISTEFVDIWYIKHDLNLTLTNLKVSLLSTVTVAKVVTFLIWQKHWKNIINYVNKTDKIQRNDADTDEENDKKDIIDKYTKYSRSITYCYGLLMLTTIIFIVSQPIIRCAVSKSYRDNIRNGTEYYALPVSTWIPFNKNTIVGYIVTCLYMDYAAFYGGAWITSFDTTAICIMVFFRGELEMLKVDSGKICKSDNCEEFRRRFKNCHRRHVKLIKYTRLFDSCLSPIMLLYMIVCSVMLCSTVYQLNVDTSVMQRIVTAEYLIFGVAQLFMYCWHSNDVFYVSKNLFRGPYESVWWTRSVPEQRDISILVNQFNKVIFFNAGPFYSITIATFITILKGAYSYYTILSKSYQD